jgi:diguanylate cyclase (GGDEF)-like protein
MREKSRRIRSYSTRSYLVATLLIVTVVVTSLGIYFAVVDSHRAARDAGAESLFEAKLASASVADALTSSLQTLTDQVTDPATARLVKQALADPSSCSTVAASGGFGAFPDGELYYFDLDGRIVCGSVPGIKKDATMAGTLWFASVSAKPLMTDPYTDPITGKRSIAVVGYLEADGRRFAGFASTLVFDSLAPALTKQYGGRLHTAFDLVDIHDGTLLSGSPSALWRNTSPLKAVEGVTRFAADGSRRIYSAVLVKGKDWILEASVPESLALAPARASEHHQILLALIALVVLFILGLAINRNIVGPIRRLRTAVEQAARDVVPAPLAPEGPLEIARLVQEFNSMVSSRAQYEERLTHQALHDHLTGLPNRALLIDRIAKALERAGRTGEGLGVLFADLDRFRVLNDALGHVRGDSVMRLVARRIESVIRPGDSVGRLNADEFVILCEGIASPEQLGLMADRIGSAIAEPLAVEGKEVTVTASIGIAIAHEDDTATDLIRNADVAMMRAKELGKARHEFFDLSMRDRALSRLQIESDLRHALDRGELLLNYQPIVDVREGVVGAEALVRWQHPTSGLQPPLSFIPVAEETGMIVPIGLFILESACRQAAAWHASGKPLRVSVNLSARQLIDEDLPQHVRRILLETDLPASSLCLEITESTLINEAIQPVVLERLKDIGVMISIDDFGTGYSSLSYIQRFPVDELKIDRSFVRALSSEDSSEALVEAIIHLAGAIGMEVVVEGVEQAQELETLKRLGCSRLQGYYFMRPGSADQIRRYAPPLTVSA